MTMKERVRDVSLWSLLILSGGAGIAANVGGAASAERVARLEEARELDSKRLDRIEDKLDRVLERVTK